MFENITAEVLNRLLGSYVSPSSFQADRVSTSVYKGHVLLSRLELRQDALDRLLLPVSLKKGLIMRAEISIPWTQLGSKPVELSLDGVYLQLNPKVDWSDNEIESRAQAAKAAKLVQAELIKRSKEAVLGLGKLVDGSSSDASFTSRLMSKITDNVEIRLKNVHVRYDDEVSSFCFGMTLESLAIQTTDAQWIPRFKESSDGQTHKLCKLDGFSIYGDPASFNSGGSVLFANSEEGFTRFFADGISHKERAKHHAYIVRPMDVAVRLTMHRDMTGTRMDIFCKTLDVRLESFQLANLIHVSKIFASAPSSVSPLVSGLKRPIASPMQDPKGWWLYAYSFVQKQIKERKYKWSKAYFAKRRRDRLEYTVLWKRHLMSSFAEENRTYPPLSSQDRVRMEWLEKCLDFNDIMLFRSYAENALRLEKAHQELWELTAARSGNAVSGNAPNSSSNAAIASKWISWALGMSSQQGNGYLKESLSQQDVERFLAVLRHNPAATILESGGSNDNLVAMIVSFTIPKGSIYFHPVRVSFKGIDMEFTQRMNGSSLISLGVEEFRVNDGFQRVLGPRGEYFNNKRRQRSATVDDLVNATSFWNADLVPVKNLESLESLDLADSRPNDEARAGESKKRREDGLVYLKLDTKPPYQPELDKAITIKIRPLEVVYSAAFISKCVETIESLPQPSPSSGVSVRALPSNTARSPVAIELDIKSPMIILPVAGTPGVAATAALVADLGRFSIQDQAIRTKAQVKLALESQNIQDERLFDVYSLHISRVSVWLHSNEKKSKLPVIDRFSIRGVINICVQSIPHVPHMKLALEGLEVINIRMSAKKIGLLARVLRDIAPKSQTVEGVEIKESYQKCPFVHSVPPSGCANEGEDDQMAILNEPWYRQDDQDGDGDNIGENNNNTNAEFDASSEFFSVLGDELDERTSFVSRNQRFFDALNGDDTQSEARTRTSSRRRLTMRGQDQVNGGDRSQGGGGPGTVISEDDQQSFFTADSSFRRSRSGKIVRRTSQVSSRKDEVLFKLTTKIAGVAFYFSQTSEYVAMPQATPAVKTALGSPISVVTYQRTHPSLSLRRNGSSVVSGAAMMTPQVADKRELPVHVQNWLEELRQLEGVEVARAVTPIQPMPSASPTPLTTGSSQGGGRRTGDRPRTATSSEVSSILHETDSESDGATERDETWDEELLKKERVTLIFRVDNLGFQAEQSSFHRSVEFTVGHIVLEELLLEAGDEEIFSRYLIHTGLRMDAQDKLSFHGEDEEAAMIGRIDMTPPIFGSRGREPAITEANLAILRPIDCILNERVLRECIFPAIQDISIAISADNAFADDEDNPWIPQTTVTPRLSILKTNLAISQIRLWAVDARSGPFAMVKATKMDFTSEEDREGRSHIQGRLYDMEGSYFKAGSSHPFVFLSRRLDVDDETVPLASFIAIRHPTTVQRNEIVVEPSVTPPTPPSVFLTEEDIADHVIDSILGPTSSVPKSGSNSPTGWSFLTNATEGTNAALLPPKSPGRPRTLLESVEIDYQGDEIFVNVAPVKLALCEPLVKQFITFPMSIPATQPKSKVEKRRKKAFSHHPLSIRYLMTMPMLELVHEPQMEDNCLGADQARKLKTTIGLGGNRLEGSNKLFLSSGVQQKELLMERKDILVADGFIDVNGQRITTESVELRIRMVEQRIKMSYSALDLKLNQEQLRTIQLQMGIYVDLAVNPGGPIATDSSAPATTVSKALFIAEISQINIGLITQISRSSLVEKRGLIVRHVNSNNDNNAFGSGMSSPSSRLATHHTGGGSGRQQTSASATSIPTCFAMIKINKFIAKVVDYVQLSLELTQFSIQQGYATVKKNHFIQIVNFPEPSRLVVELNPETFFLDSISVCVLKPRFVYVPETVQDAVSFIRSLSAGGSEKQTTLSSADSAPSFIISSPPKSSATPTAAASPPPYKKGTIHVEGIEIWIGGGTFSTSLLVMEVSKANMTSLPAEEMLKLDIIGCSTSLRRDTQLPMTTPSLAFYPSTQQATTTTSVPAVGRTSSRISLLTSPILEEQNKCCILPFHLSITSSAMFEVSVSPVKFQVSFEDVAAVGKVLSDLNASLNVISAPSRNQNGRREKPKVKTSSQNGASLATTMSKLDVTVQSVMLIYMNTHGFPIVRMQVSDIYFRPKRTPIVDGIVGEGSVRVRAEHRFKRDWEILMEDSEIRLVICEPAKIRILCEKPIAVNLVQSLLDGRDAFKEESEKIRHLSNQTGLSVKRLMGRSTFDETMDDCFCLVDDPLKFRLANKSSNRTWLLEQAMCPRRGKLSKHVAVLEEHPNDTASEVLFSHITVVLETDGASSSLIITSPLKVKNETTQPIELAVALGAPHPTFSMMSGAAGGDTNSASSTTSLDQMASDPPSRSTTPDSADTFVTPGSAVKRGRTRSRAQLSQFAWTVTLAPNDSVFVPADIAHVILSGRYPMLSRPRAHVTSAPDFAFAELRLSSSAQMNQRSMKKSLAFTDFGSFSSTGSGHQKETFWTSHYVVETRWTDPFCQCLVFSAPVVLTNMLNCAATYRLTSDVAKAEGQLPVSAELKWHGQQPSNLHLLRLALKLDGFEWSDPVSLIPNQAISLQDETANVVHLDLKDDAGRVLRVEANVTARKAGRVEVMLSVPFWIVNNLDLPVLMASSMMDALGSKVSAGQSKTIAKMRRIRLANQLEEEFRASRSKRFARHHHSSNRTRIMTALNKAPTGLLELLDSEESIAADMALGPEDMEDDDNLTVMLPGTSLDSNNTLMFSSSYVKIRFWDSRWSDSCYLDHSSHQIIECKQEWRVRDPALSRALYAVAVKVEQSKSCARTKIVTLSPRFILVNGLSRAIKVRQWRGNLGELARSRSALSSTPLFSGNREANLPKDRFASTRGSGIVSLSPGERVPFHWRDKSGPKQVSACFDEFGWEWSSGIQIEDCVGEFCSRLRNRHTQRVYILRVDVQMVDDSTVVITFRPELPGLPPYRIDNLSLQTIRFRQMGAPLSSSETLLPYHSCPYTWDLLEETNRGKSAVRKKLVVETIARTDELDGGEHASATERLLALSFKLTSPSTWFRPSHTKILGVFSLDKHFGYLPSSLSHVGVSLQADGPTRVLTISDARVMSASLNVFPTSPSGQHVVTNLGEDSSGSSPSVASTTAALAQQNNTEIEFAMKEFGISFIEENPSTQSRRELLRVCLSNAEVKSTITIEGDPLVEMNLGDLQVDNQLMKATYPVLLCSNKRVENSSNNKLDHQEKDNSSPTASFLSARLVRSDRFPSLDFLKSFSLRIAPIQLNLEAEIIQAALRFVSSVNVNMATTATKPPSKRHIGGGGGSSYRLSSSTSKDASSDSLVARKAYVEDLRVDPIEVRVNFRGALALFGGSQWFGAHMEGASLYLREFRIVHSLLSASDPIANRVFVHYLQALRRHWYVLVSSVDLLGDPIGLGKTLYAGVLESVSEILSSISWDGGFDQFFKGLGRALWALFRAIVVGCSSSIVNVCNGASAALTSLSSSRFVESDFGNPRGFMESLVQGAAGLVILPYRGFENAGGRGLATGAVKGAIGVIARPLSGALRLVARVADSLRGAVDPTSKVRTDRMRTPRFLRAEQSLGVYDGHRARGEQALWSVGLSADVWIGHLVCSDRHMVVLTETRLVVLSTFNEEILGIVFTIPRRDFVLATIPPLVQTEVVLYCLPSDSRLDRKSYWSAMGYFRSTERRLKRKTKFGFDEKALKCASGKLAEKLVKMLSGWVAPSKFDELVLV